MMFKLTKQAGTMVIEPCMQEGPVFTHLSEASQWLENNCWETAEGNYILPEDIDDNHLYNIMVLYLWRNLQTRPVTRLVLKELAKREEVLQALFVTEAAVHTARRILNRPDRVQTPETTIQSLASTYRARHRLQKEADEKRQKEESERASRRASQWCFDDTWYDTKELSEEQLVIAFGLLLGEETVVNDSTREKISETLKRSGLSQLVLKEYFGSGKYFEAARKVCQRMHGEPEKALKLIREIRTSRRGLCYSMPIETLEFVLEFV